MGLLVLDVKFVWTYRHQAAFDSTRQSIANKVGAGFKFFVVGREIAVFRDWSKKGLGFLLLLGFFQCVAAFPQRYCHHPGYLPKVHQ